MGPLTIPDAGTIRTQRCSTHQIVWDVFSVWYGHNQYSFYWQNFADVFQWLSINADKDSCDRRRHPWTGADISRRCRTTWWIQHPRNIKQSRPVQNITASFTRSAFRRNYSKLALYNTTAQVPTVWYVSHHHFKSSTFLDGELLWTNVQRSTEETRTTLYWPISASWSSCRWFKQAICYNKSTSRTAITAKWLCE